MTIDHDSEAFATLSAQQIAAKNTRIANALSFGNGPDAATIQERHLIANLLYVAFYSFKDDPTDTEYLEQFVWSVFGCSSREIIHAWDRELG